MYLIKIKEPKAHQITTIAFPENYLIPKAQFIQIVLLLITKTRF